MVISITSLWINNDYALSICNIFEFRSICFIWVSTLVLSSMQREYYRHIRFSCHRSRYIEPVFTHFVIDSYSAFYVIGLYTKLNIINQHIATQTIVNHDDVIVITVGSYLTFISSPTICYICFKKCFLFVRCGIVLHNRLDCTVSTDFLCF